MAKYGKTDFIVC